MPPGTRRLLLLTVPSPARALLESLGVGEKLALARDTGGHPADAVRDCVAAAVDALVAERGGPAWDAAGFAALRSFVAERLVVTATGVLRAAGEVHGAAYVVREQLAVPAPERMRPAFEDLAVQLAALVPADVATSSGVSRLPHVLRYLRAMQRRLDLVPKDVERDLVLMDRVHVVEDAWHDALDALPAGTPVPAELADVRWLLEELRVSLFAQQLGTAQKVSEKRILQLLADSA